VEASTRDAAPAVRLAGRLAPILPSGSFEATARFYERLGFTVAPDPDGDGLTARRDAFELRFFSCPDVRPPTNDHGVLIRLADGVNVDELYGQWRGSGARRLAPPVATGDGRREFAVTDPDGNLLRVTGPAPGAPVTPGAAETPGAAGAGHAPV
jgi:catechol 2,3-dioxygenase-like lactoylglutathione lyase family enzyme